MAHNDFSNLNLVDAMRVMMLMTHEDMTRERAMAHVFIERKIVEATFAVVTYVAFMETGCDTCTKIKSLFDKIVENDLNPWMDKYLKGVEELTDHHEMIKEWAHYATLRATYYLKEQLKAKKRGNET